MLFNTTQYIIIFLPIVVFIYYLLPSKIQFVWLLITSYYFYMQWNPLYITLLFLCTLLTYACARIISHFNSLIESEKDLKNSRIKKKHCLILCIVLNLFILIYFKYSTFGISLLNQMFHIFHIKEISWTHDILLPVGISFYTLQALGYIIDVYRGEIYAEKNFFKYALFVSFFPQLVAGPIERSKNLLIQLNKTHKFKYENFQKGFLLILYGLFLKMVIADRAAIIVNTVYEDSMTYSGFYIPVATIFFSIQIYCDFYGYSTIARGSALLLDIKLMDNFDAPYYAKSIKDFWRRWHISLSSWFRDYLYIPLGGNRKGIVHKEMNLLTVFAISGLWHGASLTFIFWGILNGLYQVFADIFTKIKLFIRRQLTKLNIATNNSYSFSRQLFQTIFTFILISFAWLFFRAGTTESACKLLLDMFSVNNWTILFDGSLYELGVPKNYMNILFVSIFTLFFVDYHKYHQKDILAQFLKQGMFFQVFITLILLFAILLYGCYGEIYDIQQFIYFQF